MIPAPSLSFIREKAGETLGRRTVERTMLDVGRIRGFSDTQFFRPDSSINMPRTKTVQVEEDQTSKLIGILFCTPTSPLGKGEVIPNLEYFHYRSGAFVDFFCAGYGAYWPEIRDDEAQTVGTIAGVQWLFSARKYNECRTDVESVANWRYSGETDLILLVARKQPAPPVQLDFSTAIACNLEAMAKDQAFTSVRAFFEEIFRFGEDYDGSDPVWDISDKFGVGAGKNFLRDAILSILPKNVASLYKAAHHYVIKDISK